jgi:hypothetical protein
MLVMSGLIGIPVVLGSRFLRRAPELLQYSAAIASVAFGVYYGWQIIS